MCHPWLAAGVTGLIGVLLAREIVPVLRRPEPGAPLDHGLLGDGVRAWFRARIEPLVDALLAAGIRRRLRHRAAARDERDLGRGIRRRLALHRRMAAARGRHVRRSRRCRWRARAVRRAPAARSSIRSSIATGNSRCSSASRVFPRRLAALGGARGALRRVHGELYAGAWRRARRSVLDRLPAAAGALRDPRRRVADRVPSPRTSRAPPSVAYGVLVTGLVAVAILANVTALQRALTSCARLA